MIKTLAQIVPGCQKKDSTTGNVVGVSLKGIIWRVIILSPMTHMRVCVYIVCVQQRNSAG